MENIITIVYKRESEAYQALAELKRDQSNYAYKIIQLGIVKKENGIDTPVEGFDSDLEKRSAVKGNTKLMKYAVAKASDNAVIIVALVEEHEDIVLNNRLAKFKPVITRYEVKALQKEMDDEEKAKKQAAKAAKKSKTDNN